MFCGTKKSNSKNCKESQSDRHQNQTIWDIGVAFAFEILKILDFLSCILCVPPTLVNNAQRSNRELRDKCDLLDKSKEREKSRFAEIKQTTNLKIDPKQKKIYNFSAFFKWILTTTTSKINSSFAQQNHKSYFDEFRVNLPLRVVRCCYYCYYYSTTGADVLYVGFVIGIIILGGF